MDSRSPLRRRVSHAWLALESSLKSVKDPYRSSLFRSIFSATNEIELSFWPWNQPFNLLAELIGGEPTCFRSAPRSMLMRHSSAGQVSTSLGEMHLGQGGHRWSEHGSGKTLPYLHAPPLFTDPRRSPTTPQQRSPDPSRTRP